MLHPVVVQSQGKRVVLILRLGRSLVATTGNVPLDTPDSVLCHIVFVLIKGILCRISPGLLQVCLIPLVHLTVTNRSGVNVLRVSQTVRVARVQDGGNLVDILAVKAILWRCVPRGNPLVVHRRVRFTVNHRIPHAVIVSRRGRVTRVVTVNNFGSVVRTRCLPYVVRLR